ncbi:zinc ribbon domain-containing protein [Acidovorax sp. NCPPB 4044]|uniref:zinc ribbon domain-containing protein n=1 Tax=Acidovorax sp. NCPPB 4044 TaxID=2940490 RepID=UPI0023022323|nr:hypothetical protein [Acidovorax sp. NCPPB 4044]MDA8522011.1 zinc ribbon domain-containing protein [Acidovorax sp. NCPPB 4044]
MALISCAECGKNVSDKAPACPHCGAPTSDAAIKKYQAQKRWTSNAPVIGVLIFTALVVVSCIAVGSKTKPREWARDDYKSTAISVCKSKIKEAAHDPSSVEFPANDRFEVINGDGPSWQLKVTIRAKNGFGALRLADYLCVVGDIAPQLNGGVTYKALAVPAP